MIWKLILSIWVVICVLRTRFVFWKLICVWKLILCFENWFCVLKTCFVFWKLISAKAYVIWKRVGPLDITPLWSPYHVHITYGVHIMPLVINSLGGRQTDRHKHTHTYTYRHSQTEAILRNQACAGLYAWFNKFCIP